MVSSVAFIIFLLFIFIAIAVVRQVNSKRTGTRKLDYTYLLFNLVTLGIQITFITIYVSDQLKSLGTYGTLLWIISVILGILFFIAAIVRGLKHGINMFFYFITGVLGIGILGLYLLASFITSM